MAAQRSAEPVFTVHVTKPDEVGAVEIIFRSEREACSYAMDRSRDFRITSASVTRFVLAELGTRHPVAGSATARNSPSASTALSGSSTRLPP
jgi:hypothetical protein